MIARRALGTSRSIDSSSSRELAADSCCRDSLASGDSGTDQLLIFTKGSQTYTPHQVGIKRMPSSASELLSQQSAHDDDIETQDFGQNEDDAVDDKVDETIELHGHIIGMNLSPDHRWVSPSQVSLLCWLHRWVSQSQVSLLCWLHRWVLWSQVSLPITGESADEECVSLGYCYWLIDWFIEQGLTSPPIQYRLYGRRFIQVKRPNQQCQSTEGTQRVHR